MNFHNLFLKFFNNKKYRDNKFLYKINIEKKIFEENIEIQINEIIQSIKNKKNLNFLHSGHCGDLLYSLPIIKELSKSHKCNLYIGVNKEMKQEYYKHPAKGVLIDDRMFNLILPLLKSQNYFNEVKAHTIEEIDINLDLYKELPINAHFNSSKWYSHVTGIKPDLSKSYLEVTNHNSITNKIVILRSLRNRNHFISYEFFNNFNEDFLFIGLKEEYDDLKKQIHNLVFYEISDFFEMGQIIKSSKFFVGNQSLAYSIAEGLKVPRLLENAPAFTVVHPTGGDCYDFYFQAHFEKFFNILYKNYS